MAKRRMRANFEFIKKLGVDRWCFHDRDIAPDAKTMKETNANLDEVGALAKDLQPDSIPVMGDKATGRETMKKAGVPTVPGSDRLLQSTEESSKACRRDWLSCDDQVEKLFWV